MSTLRSETSTSVSLIQQLGQVLDRWFVAPIHSLTEVDQRNARLLVLFTLPILVLTFIPFSMTGWELRFVPTLVLLAFTYGFSRTRYFRAGTILFAVGVSLASYIAVATREGQITTESLDASFMWLVSVLLVSSAIGSITDVGILIVLFFIGQIVTLFFVQSVSLREASGPLGFLLANAILIVIAMRHRSQLEKIRLDELRAATEAMMNAQESEKIKTQFLASMSHELRTPLNAVLNFSQIMSMGRLGEVNKRQEDALLEIVASGKHLLGLINDVLDMSKIQSGMLTLSAEKDVNLTEIINSVVGTTRSLIGDNPVELIIDMGEALPPILGDKRRIQQVLLNLLSNAVKFTQQGTITLHVRHERDLINFSVTDTGPGIAESDREIIFRPFEQSRTGIRQAAGTGLGLSISRSLVEAHGGAMWVDSVEGRGATFTFTLPVANSKLLTDAA